MLVDALVVDADAPTAFLPARYQFGIPVQTEFLSDSRHLLWRHLVGLGLSLPGTVTLLARFFPNYFDMVGADTLSTLVKSSCLFPAAFNGAIWYLCPSVSCIYCFIRALVFGWIEKVLTMAANLHFSFIWRLHLWVECKIDFLLHP